MRRVFTGALLVLIVVIGAGLLLFRPAFASEGNCVRVGEDLIIPTGEHCSGDGVAIGGDLLVYGTVEGNAVAVGGDVWVGGKVSGDVVSLGGKIFLRDESQVKGNVVALAGLLYRDPGAVVEGELLESEVALPGRIAGADWPVDTEMARLWVALLSSVLAFGVCMLMVVALRSFFVRRTDVVVGTLREHLFPSLGMGMASTLLLVVLLPLASLLLGLVIIGIPLIPFLYLIAGLLYVAGLAIAGLALGETLYVQGERRPRSRWLPPLVGLAILVPLTMIPGVAIPCLGPVWAVFIPSVGLGAIVLSRAGTVVWSDAQSGSRGR